jgi:hypothetical protein
VPAPSPQPSYACLGAEINPIIACGYGHLHGAAHTEYELPDRASTTTSRCRAGPSLGQKVC